PGACDALVPRRLRPQQRTLLGGAGSRRRPAGAPQPVLPIAQPDAAGRAGHPRLESLDVFRGTTIAAMILVSTPGTWDAVYGALEHAAWDGWTPTDLVFPFLLFAMGAAVPFAMARRRPTASAIRRHVLRRAAILFALGLLLNAIETAPPLEWATFRIPGVLQ